MRDRDDEIDGDQCDACAACEYSQPRRDFLRQAGLAAIGALVTVGVPRDLAAVMRPAMIESRSRSGSDPSYPIPAADGVQIDKDNQVILVRWKNAVFAFNLSCPHQNTALRWNADKTEFQCPKHHSRYMPDGTFIDGRATRNMDRFTLTQAGSTVVVHVGQMHKSDADGSGWAASVIELPSEE